MMKVIIAGGRNFNDYEFLSRVCDIVLSRQTAVEVVSGTANGADTLGEKYAYDNGLLIKKFPADWDKYGKSAGYRRNSQMADYADALIAFWDGASKGTKHMIDLARRGNLKVKVVYFSS